MNLAAGLHPALSPFPSLVPVSVCVMARRSSSRAEPSRVEPDDRNGGCCTVWVMEIYESSVPGGGGGGTKRVE